ncbi:uncharacterized protein LOC141630781 [Silene latifolia]|uniref:uncharacterized protein LOC141630781 n=1 Tax=Silene latifolia TaxID=37657 RepID=UPI003D77564E
MSSPLYLHPSDSPNMSLTRTKFNGDNYDLWAGAVRNGLDAKNKLGFIEGKVGKPPGDEEDNIELVALRQCNAMLRGWLRISIEEKLHASITFSGSVKEIWDKLRDRYTARNAPRVHELKGELSECKQRRESVVEYYTRLKVIWDELANYSRVTLCTCGAAAALTKEREEEKVHQFLMGLDSTLYGNLRSNILMEDPITSLTKAYSLVLREERHANMMKEKEKIIEAAMAVKTYGAGRGRAARGNQSVEVQEGVPQCTHCGKYYHTEEACYDKHGYEAVKAQGRGRGRRGAGSGRGSFGRGGGRSGGPNQNGTFQANAVGTSTTVKETETQPQPFNAEEIDRIRIMLASSPEGSDKFTGMSNNIDVEWLIDSGCSHHMTGRRECLTNILKMEKSLIGLQDGRKVEATDHGEVILSKNFVLQDDRSSRMEIGRGDARDGVYYFRKEKQNVACKVDVTKESMLGESNSNGDSTPLESQNIQHETSVVDNMHQEEDYNQGVLDNNTHEVRGSEESIGEQETPVRGHPEDMENQVEEFLEAINETREPQHYFEAAKNSKWRDAMRKEIDALEINGTWRIVSLPNGKKPIGCKWVYKIKYKADGTIKIQSSTRGARVYSSGRNRLSRDIRTGGENDKHLEEEVYMRIPQGFEKEDGNKVCKLEKSLYGLKQASRKWFSKLTEFLREYGFIQSWADYSAFRCSKDCIFIGVLVYVDDMVIVSNNSEACREFKQCLDKRFGIKDLGRLKYFMGIEVAQSSKGILLNQRKYALGITEEAGQSQAKPVHTPIQQHHNLALAKGELLKDVMKYRRVVGRLIYLTITRPDLVYAVHVLSQFVHEPRKEHWDGAMRVIRYLKMNPNKGIIINGNSNL